MFKDLGQVVLIECPSTQWTQTVLEISPKNMFQILYFFICDGRMLTSACLTLSQTRVVICVPDPSQPVLEIP